MSNETLQQKPSLTTEEWLNHQKTWLKKELLRGVDPQTVINIMLTEAGLDLETIRTWMGVFFPDASAHESTAIDFEAIARVRITRPDSGLNVQQVPVENVQLYMLEQFLTETECDRLVDIAAKYQRDSVVTTGEKGYRKSKTSDLYLSGDPLVRELDERIARTLGICLPYSEDIETQHYDVDGEFRPHLDCFEEGTPVYAAHAGDRGQRTWTFMVYLNNCEVGGATSFLKLNQNFQPRKGMALIWNNLTTDGRPNPATLHAGLPVEAGQKTIITKWFRTRGTGEMFY